jgi:hypothetical protein
MFRVDSRVTSLAHMDSTINLCFYLSFKPIQHEVPPGKHALITVKQPKGNLVWIMAGSQQTQQQQPGKTIEKEKTKPKLQTWDECDVIQVCRFRWGLC